MMMIGALLFIEDHQVVFIVLYENISCALFSPWEVREVLFYRREKQVYMKVK